MKYFAYAYICENDKSHLKRDEIFRPLTSEGINVMKDDHLRSMQLIERVYLEEWNQWIENFYKVVIENTNLFWTGWDLHKELFCNTSFADTISFEVPSYDFFILSELTMTIVDWKYAGGCRNMIITKII